MNIVRCIDYIWFVGESFHGREKAPGDGETLLMWCWYLDAFLPLLTAIHKVEPGWPFYVIAMPILMFFPFLYCRLRYTERRKKEIFSRFHGSYTGKHLLLIWMVMISICSLETFLMLRWNCWE